jgi:exo-beta-1,3-glucanase (GH17 family)
MCLNFNLICRDKFGFDGSKDWMTRRDSLFGTLHSNPKAMFVTRGVQFGSEPLFDGVLTPDQLTTQVVAAKSNLSSLQIPVTVSELAYGYAERGGAQNVLDAVDYINIHMLPFFSQSATTGRSLCSYRGIFQLILACLT